MRLAVGLFAVLLGGSVAMADDAKPAPEAKTEAKPEVKAKTGLRVVRVMPESHQALLFDKNRGTHVLVDVDGTIDGYKVSDIDEDAVTLVKDGSEIVLAAPFRRSGNGNGNGNGDGKVAARDGKPTKSDTAPVDPYADPKDPKAPVDPYADAKTDAKDAKDPKPANPYDEPAVRTVEAPKPIDPGAGGVRVASADPAPASKTSDVSGPAKAPTATPSPTPSPSVTPAPAPVPPPTVATPTGDLVLTRAAFKAELADFTKLANGVHAAFVDNGVRLDAIVATSLFARAGLQANDIITAVNGQALHSIDDAAELYARSSSAKAISIQVLRAGKPVTLHVSIQ